MLARLVKTARLSLRRLAAAAVAIAAACVTVAGPADPAQAASPCSNPIMANNPVDFYDLGAWSSPWTRAPRRLGTLYLGYYPNPNCRRVYAEFHWNQDGSVDLSNKVGYIRLDDGYQYQGGTGPADRAYDNANSGWWTSGSLRIDNYAAPKRFTPVLQINHGAAVECNDLALPGNWHTFSDGGNGTATRVNCGF
ncbi:hypothetical protein [Streptomyces silvisoli]|uniref:Secreted protein n=1 Tax=Streptomyces silvisoli TaxID=3034235 RepID=A0ABT5ZXA1_9ACTN|nr:hypothetical protein [Streptomyces silvisoli]MDF3294276.1 hypothetical protein [Streptomyces silvisoli]